jgi:hypothetical protein
MSDYQPTPPPSTPYTGGPAPAKSQVLSILALVAGILGVILSWTGIFGLIVSAAGIVLGLLGRRREPGSRALWLTGLILSIVGAVIAIILIVLAIMIVSTYRTS